VARLRKKLRRATNGVVAASRPDPFVSSEVQNRHATLPSHYFLDVARSEPKIK
jgi:hypothetical protein